MPTGTEPKTHANTTETFDNNPKTANTKNLPLHMHAEPLTLKQLQHREVANLHSPPAKILH